MRRTVYILPSLRPPNLPIIYTPNGLTINILLPRLPNTRILSLPYPLINLNIMPSAPKQAPSPLDIPHASALAQLGYAVLPDGTSAQAAQTGTVLAKNGYQAGSNGAPAPKK
ncbi:hypothetical protein QCA50_014408 [Cerrena zonata]|uniref:Uncharacterized protein n=1 Tax=Cerrena zonata TaxID=2478898 RepID=A0AAW0FYC7_9APHY